MFHPVGKMRIWILAGVLLVCGVARQIFDIALGHILSEGNCEGSPNHAGFEDNAL
jgi:hypothetical protein